MIEPMLEMYRDARPGSCPADFRMEVIDCWRGPGVERANILGWIASDSDSDAMDMEEYDHYINLLEGDGATVATCTSSSPTSDAASCASLPRRPAAAAPGRAHESG